MADSSVNPFCVTSRAVGIYDSLRTDVEAESDQILTSLPRFVRIALIEGTPGWAQAVNRYDLLVEVSTSRQLGTLTLLSANLETSTTVKPSGTDKRSQVESAFREATIVKLDGEEFSVQDFVLAVAYHGTFHLDPNTRPELKRLYDGFIVKNPAMCLQLALDIGRCLVDAFEEVRKKFSGDNTAYCSVNDRQPLIANAGTMITFGSGEAAGKHSESYMQIPVRAQEGLGIRVCIDLQIPTLDAPGTLFTYGHRAKEGIRLALEYNPGGILGRCHSRNNRATVRVPLPGAVQYTRHTAELSVYPDGTVLLAIDEWLRRSEALDDRFEITDGKIMIGSSLSGDRFGSFLNAGVSVEAIQPDGRLSNIFVGGLDYYRSNAGLFLPSDASERPALRG